MTIDINKLRRLAQAATPGPWYVKGKLTRYVEARIDGGLIQEVAACGPTKADGGYGPQQEANARLIAAANPAAINELLDRLEAAESDALEEARLNGMGSEREAALLSKLEAAEKERDALRAKIAEMERQEPVARLLTWVGRDPYNKNRVIARTYDELNKNAYPEWEEGSPLYLTHVAQPQLNEIKTALQRALELGQRETWTGARKHRSWEDQREEQQCWNKVWRLLGAQGEEKWTT